MCERKCKLESVVVEAVKFLWKRKHFEERSWNRKQTRKRLTSYEAGQKQKYSTASTSLIYTIPFIPNPAPDPDFPKNSYPEPTPDPKNEMGLRIRSPAPCPSLVQTQ